MRAVASRVSSSDTGDILLLDNVSIEDSDYDQPEPHNVVASSYIPSYVSNITSTSYSFNKSNHPYSVVKLAKCPKVDCFG